MWWFSPFVDMNQPRVVLEGLGRKEDGVHDSLEDTGSRAAGSGRKAGEEGESHCVPRTLPTRLPGAKSRAGVKGEREEREREREMRLVECARCLSENIRDERGGPSALTRGHGQGLVSGQGAVQGDKLESPVRGSEIFSVIGPLYTPKN